MEARGGGDVVRRYYWVCVAVELVSVYTSVQKNLYGDTKGKGANVD
jgi:hypothetical protein